MYADQALQGALCSEPWNKGKLVGPTPPFKFKEIWEIRVRSQLSGRTRELALFSFAIDSKLRGRDLVAPRVGDVFRGGHVATRAAIVQRKTGHPVRFELTEQTRASICGPTSTCFRVGFRLRPARQYGRIVKVRAALIGLDPGDYGTHSLRRSKAILMYRRTKNLRAVQLLLGHTKLESTVRHLGVEVDDALAISERTEV